MSDLKVEIHNLFVTLASQAPEKTELFHEFVEEHDLEEDLYSWLSQRLEERHKNVDQVAAEALVRLEDAFPGKWEKSTNLGGEGFTLRYWPNSALSVRLVNHSKEPECWRWHMELDLSDVHSHGNATDPVVATREALMRSLAYMNDHRGKVTQHLDDLDEIEALCAPFYEE